ncbi:Peritrophin-48, partial [Acromyrmex echinatior]
ICLLTIAFLASWTIITASKLPIIFETEDECPVSNISPLPKLIFHETDCTKYYECKNGQKQLRFCKVGLYFSKRWFGCVTPEISECSPLTPTVPNLECPVPDTCPPKLIIHEKECNKYYECKDGQKHLRSCGAGLYFSQKWQGCVEQQVSDCPSGDSGEQCPTTDDCPPKLIPIKQDCTKYYECKNSKKELRFCKAGLYFSQYWQGCVSQEHSECFIDPECPIPDSCPPKLISDKKDCTKYYECKNSKKEPRSCKVGLYFSQYWQGCVNREHSDCLITTPTPIPTTQTPIPTTQTPIPTTQTPIPTTQTPIPTTPRCINGELLEHECTCTKYYLCIEGYKAVFECSPGKHFDISTKTCQPGTSCLQVIPSPISNPITSQCTESEYMPHEYECKKYYECKVDLKILRECNDGMIFNKALQTCVLGQC